jgi:hypothetical protein
MAPCGPGARAIGGRRAARGARGRAVWAPPETAARAFARGCSWGPAAATGAGSRCGAREPLEGSPAPQTVTHAHTCTHGARAASWRGGAHTALRADPRLNFVMLSPTASSCNPPHLDADAASNRQAAARTSTNDAARACGRRPAPGAAGACDRRRLAGPRPARTACPIASSACACAPLAWARPPLRRRPPPTRARVLARSRPIQLDISDKSSSVPAAENGPPRALPTGKGIVYSIRAGYAFRSKEDG